MTPPMTAADVIKLLNLQPLPAEGGLYRQTYADDYGTAIYYLIGWLETESYEVTTQAEYSAMHRLPGVEVFHHYAGDPVRMLLLHPDGSQSEPLLGPDLANEQRPQVVVPGNTWQGCYSAGDESGVGWSLLGATMAPGYRDEDFEISPAAPLIDKWPAAEQQIRALTRR